MNAVFIFLTVAIVIASVLLVIVVLLQNGKGDGMASNFVAANQVSPPSVDFHTPPPLPER